MRRKRKTFILKLTRHNGKEEREFELKFMRSLTVAQRFEMMFKISDIVKRMLIKHGHRKPFEVIKRT